MSNVDNKKKVIFNVPNDSSNNIYIKLHDEEKSVPANVAAYDYFTSKGGVFTSVKDSIDEIKKGLVTVKYDIRENVQNYFDETNENFTILKNDLEKLVQTDIRSESLFAENHQYREDLKNWIATELDQRDGKISNLENEMKEIRSENEFLKNKFLLTFAENFTQSTKNVNFDEKIEGLNNLLDENRCMNQDTDKALISLADKLENVSEIMENMQQKDGKAMATTNRADEIEKSVKIIADRVDQVEKEVEINKDSIEQTSTALIQFVVNVENSQNKTDLRIKDIYRYVDEEVEDMVKTNVNMDEFEQTLDKMAKCNEEKHIGVRLKIEETKEQLESEILDKLQPQLYEQKSLIIHNSIITDELKEQFEFLSDDLEKLKQESIIISCD